MVRWCGGQGVLEVRRWGSGGEVLAAFWIWLVEIWRWQCGWYRARLVFPNIWFSDCFQICWDLQDFFWVVEGFQICWGLQVSGIWFNSTAWVLTVSFSLCRRPPTFDLRSCFLDSYGPSNYDSSRKLVSSSVSTGWVGGHWCISINVL
jgi:hypothetical protein